MSTETHSIQQSDDLAYPLLYHAQHLDYGSDIPFWLDLGRLHGDPILELGCGTGRVLTPLAEAGYTVYGLDLSPGMLAILRNHISPSIAAKVHICQADLTSFHIDARFPLIILPCNTFSTLSDSARRSALKQVHRHLQPGGVFSFSIPNPKILALTETTDQAEIEMIFPHPETGDPVQLSYEITRAAQHIRLDWHYDHLKPDGQVSRLSIATQHQLISTDQYLHELIQVGYSIQNLYGDFDCSPLQDGSSELVITAKRI